MEHNSRHVLLAGMTTPVAMFSFLETRKSIYEAAIAYFDKRYLTQEGISENDLKEINNLELNFIGKEVYILDIIKKRKDAGVDIDIYNEYVDKNFSFIEDMLFSASTKSEVNAFFKKVDELFGIVKKSNDLTDIKPLIDERDNYLALIEKKDKLGSKTERTASALVRYKRIFIKRQLLIFSYCHAQATMYREKIKNGDATVKGFDRLIFQNKDFAYSEFIELFQNLSVSKNTLEHSSIQGSDDGRAEIVRLLRAELNTKNEAFKEKYLNKEMNHEKGDYTQYDNDKKEIEVLRYKLEQRVNSFSYKDRFNDRITNFSKKEAADEFGKYMISTIGFTVGCVLWDSVNGRSTKDAWIATSKEVGLVAAKGIALGISKVFLGGIINESMLNYIFGTFLPAQPNPVLDGIKEIKDKLDEIGDQIRELSSKLTDFEQNMTRKLDFLGDEVQRELVLNQIIEHMYILLSLIRNNYNSAKKINSGESPSKTEIQNLINHDDEVLKAFNTVLIRFYGTNTSINISDYSYDMGSTVIDPNAFVYKVISTADSAAYPKSHYTSAKSLIDIFTEVFVEHVKLYQGSRQEVKKALSVFYAEAYDVKKTSFVEDGILLNSIGAAVTNHAKISAMLYSLTSQLRNNVFGDGNYYLYSMMNSYAGAGKYNFNFVKSFGIQSVAGKPLRCADNNRKLVEDNHYQRYYIKPGFEAKDTKSYIVLSFDKDLTFFGFEARFTMLLDGKAKISINGLDTEVILVPLDDLMAAEKTIYENHFVSLMARNAALELSTDKKYIDLEVPYLKIVYYWVVSGNGASDSVVALYNKNTDKIQYLIPSFRREAKDKNPYFLTFNGTNVSFGITGDAIHDETNMFTFWDAKRSPIKESTQLGIFHYVTNRKITSGAEQLINNLLIFTSENYIKTEGNCTEFFAGQVMARGEYLSSPKFGSFVFGLQNDGNLVLKDKGLTKPYWASNFWDGKDEKGGHLLQLNAKGNLIQYGPSAEILWQSYTNYNNVTTRYPVLKVQDDGMVRLDGENPNSTPSWFSPMNRKDELQANQRLYRGEYLLWEGDSKTPNVWIKLDDDGYLKCYFDSRKLGKSFDLKWTVNSPSSAEYLLMKSDGNLVLINEKGNQVWESKTSGEKVLKIINTNPYCFIKNKENNNGLIAIPDIKLVKVSKK
jgi:hypothetical protein